MPESTEAPTAPKTHDIEIPKGQHDILASLLNQISSLQAQLQVALTTSLAGAKKVPQNARLIGTGGTANKFGKTRHYVRLES